MPTSANVDLKHRLDLFGITAQTRANVERFQPVFTDHADELIRKFYQHIRSFPEVQRIIKDATMEIYLRGRQKAHWQTMFACHFDDSYATSAMAVGTAHQRAGVAPYLYISGYNYFLCETLNVALQHFSGLEVAGIVTSVTRVINLDMELALTAYTRQVWGKAARSNSKA